MAPQRNLLLGNGHHLTTDVQIIKGMDPPPPPYTFAEARTRLTTQVARTVKDFATLPDAACPEDFAVGVITIHPQYTAKSFFPGTLLREAGLEPLGSRPTTVTPDKVRNERKPKEAETVQLYVATRRDNFATFAKQLPNWTEARRGASELFEIEQIRAVTTKDKVVPIKSKDKEDVLLEVVLHTGGDLTTDFILQRFSEYAASLESEPAFGKRFEIGGLCFVPVKAPRESVEALATFSFLRTAREMPSLRPLRPATGGALKTKAFTVTLPPGGPVDPTLECAVFDGGIPAAGPLSAYAVSIDPKGIGPSVPDYVEHGAGVTSAALFGPLQEGEPVPQPFGVVHHYRVLDTNSTHDKFELYDALNYIRDTLQSRKYPFVNLSVGPALPIEDKDVHAWTAVLDALTSDGETVMTIAAGNTGDKNPLTGYHRVQVPSDCVNGLAVGATHSLSKAWRRAIYSCMGPGRSPGLVKPDVVTFGGEGREPFFVLDGTGGAAIPQAGTSFASPYIMRTAMGVRAHFGDALTALTIKTLMVHSADQRGMPATEVGWGKVPDDVDSIVTCGEGQARIVYQGELMPAQYLRTPIPLPTEALEGFVKIRATFAIASDVDPEDPSNYTKNGLDVAFRPHSRKVGKGGVHAVTKPFFRMSDYDTESDLRHNSHKWETVLHHEQRFKGSSLHDPVFDVHYQVRNRGGASKRTERIRYSLVITVEAPKVPELYNQILTRYRTLLHQIRPRIDVPVRASK